MMPGIPKTPAIIAVSGLMVILMPIKLPIKLTINRRIPPSMPLIINLIINLMGITNNMPKIYNKKRPNKKAKTTPISTMNIPPLLFLLYNNGHEKYLLLICNLFCLF